MRVALPPPLLPLCAGRHRPPLNYGVRIHPLRPPLHRGTGGRRVSAASPPPHLPPPRGECRWGRFTSGAFIACRREHRLFGSAAAPRWHDAASRFAERASCGLSMARKELSYQMKNTRWRPIFALETGGSSSLEGQDFEEDAGFLGRTRLGRLIQAAARELFGKLNSVRTNSPTKIFLVLLGFYTANALATILGQTGDWDVLVAGVVVAAIEGIGMLMYKKPVAKPPGRFQSFVSMINYWKAGVCLGLFVDAFKVGS